MVEMQAWVGVREDSRIEWTVHPHEVVLAIGNLPEFEIVGTPQALRRLADSVTEAVQAFDAAQAQAGQ
ncbi:hypothetical protein [Saccharothrix algeriensis]|uniref:WYL domain-containing protein n=1 Tax=Saccharothrix algeriensis TaxID=173560 RepID=A0ABS2S6D6_9PSEU|nr:hypothetical protein [Saccharothrix algeriensis]MBM7811530.1 hypothetical protein [Saccharothrix algeriensis]